MSHPVWVRGLKLCALRICLILEVSHPVWVRGLKLQRKRPGTRPVIVAPRVGAWIETANIEKILDDRIVAPRVGAWIETGLGE